MITAAVWRRLGLLMLLAAGVATVRGYVVMDGSKWPDGTVTLRLKLGGSPGYSDGSNPNATGQAVALAWNPYLGRLQLGSSVSATGGGRDGNGESEVFFGSNVYGYEFGANVLAVTLVRSSAGRRTEADVIVNQKEAWDSYRGALRASTTDLRRVLVHEFGHVVGLDHPDEAGQSVSAIMNAYVGNIETPESDDQDGAAFLYGHGVANPPVAPALRFSNLPYDVSVTEGQGVSFEIEVIGSRPFRYQWRKDGADIPGAVAANLVIAATKLADAGLYSVVVSNDAGSVTSREARLTVNPPTGPRFQYPLTDGQTSVYLGSSLLLQVIANGTPPFSYQWKKDGVAIPGAADFSVYSRPSVTGSDAGIYTVTVTNAVGSATSPSTTVNVLPIPPPAEITPVSYQAGRFVITSLEAGFGPYTCQWFKNGVPLAGATGFSYQVPAVAAGEAAEYLVVVTSAVGTTASRAFNYVPPPVAWPRVWIAAERHAGIAYFLFASPARIERYDLASGQWLAPLPLSRAPTAFRPDAAGLLVAFGKAISRFNADGTGEVALTTATDDVTDLLVRNGIVYAFSPNAQGGVFRSFRASDGDVLETKAANFLITTAHSLSIAPGSGLILGRNDSYTNALALNADGTFAATGTPLHSDMGAGVRTFVAPDDTLVVEDSGKAYGSGLAYAGAFGGPCDDLAFTGDGRVVVLRGTQLFAYAASFAETGRRALPTAAARLFLDGSNAVAFTPPASEGAAITATRIALGSVAARAPQPRVRAQGLTYDPAQVAVGGDGIVYLLGREHGNIFRWSLAAGRYLDPLPLSGAATFIGCSPAAPVLYASYEDNRVTQFKLSPAPVERPFVSTAARIRALLPTGAFVLTNDAFGFSEAFAVAGTLAARKAFSAPDGMLTWDEARRRLYHFRNASGPTDLVYHEVASDGAIGEEKGPVYWDQPVKYPLRVAPDGGAILTGTGILFSAITLRPLATLPMPVEDGAWLGTRLYTGRSVLGGARLERWGGSSYARDAATTVPGRLLRLFALADGRLLAVVMRGGAPAFALLDPDLNAIDPPHAEVSAQPAAAVAPRGGAVTLSLSANAGGALTYSWTRNGVPLPAATTAACTLGDFKSADAGVYEGQVRSGAGAAAGPPVIVGLASSTKVVDGGEEVGSNIFVAANGNTFDQVLLTGAAASVTADFDSNQITRMSFIDLTDDIVQVEMSGPGTLSLVLTAATGPARPLLYHQAVDYMKGHAGIVITGADERTNVSVFSVGRITAVNQALFQPDAHYDGVADIAFIAITSANGKFGGVRTANANYFADRGLTGIYAPGVEFEGPVYVGDISAYDAATPLIIVGSLANSSAVLVTGGSLAQANHRAVQAAGFNLLRFVAGTTSHGLVLPARANQAAVEVNGVDVTAEIVVNPTP